MHWVFAYGSNMDLDDLDRWARQRGLQAPQVHTVAVATLAEFRLAWNYRSPSRGAGAANVEPAPGCQVPGVVLEVDEQTLHSLDLKEGHPGRYSRGDRPLPVQLASGEQTMAWVYQVTAPWRVEGSPVWPSRAYLDLVLEAARRLDLPPWHVEALEETPTSEP